MNLNTKYKEILELDRLLNEAGIAHMTYRAMDGWQLSYADMNGDFITDAIEYSGSYGAGKDLLEIAGTLVQVDDGSDYPVEGWLTAQEVFERIRNDWTTRTAGEQFAMLKLCSEHRQMAARLFGDILPGGTEEAQNAQNDSGSGASD